MQDFVHEVGQKLSRPEDELGPIINILNENWFDTTESLVSSSPEELKSLGVPLRFAKELISAAQSASGAPPPPAKESKKVKGKGRKGRQSAETSSDYQEKGNGKGKGGGEFNHRIDIEAVEPGFPLRSKLVGNQGSNVHHIQDQTGATIWFGGKTGDAMTCEIKAQTSEDLHKATGMAEDLIASVMDEYRVFMETGETDTGKGTSGEKGKGKGKRKEKGGKAKAEQARPDAGGGAFQHTINIEACEPGFPMRSKLVGNKGHNVHHIQDQTNSKLWFKGNSGESMSLTLSAETQEELDHAVQMAEDLIDSVHEEYEQWIFDEEGGGGGGGGGDKGKGKGKNREKGKGKESSKGSSKGKSKEARKGDGQFWESLDLEDCDPKFNFKGSLIGNKGRNVQHIQDNTNAKLWITGEAGGRMRIQISGDREQDVRQAVEMTEDLVEKVYDDYDKWCREHGRPGRPVSKGKSKGKSKRKGYADEPPAKRFRSY
eukprot:TRINITY_DN5947_c0_g1_i1.p1 TRINITY_DN5947_c0_g1~~TRINITY_DN5947_c0_g1_i1.p1  ORF type:complete len:510 (+),score=128.05 TRINITY_DN5947_c0_g1_i1:73-1530(+)